MSRPTPTWENTNLWKVLLNREAPESGALGTVRFCLREAELVAKKGGTNLPDFTLHDEEHAFRVAESMSKLVPEETLQAMGFFEISLLLLSAYLHDIGMTPERQIVQKHYQYIHTAGPDLVSAKELESLMAWVDREFAGLTFPLTKNRLTPGDIEQADLLLAYYCRFRHNDWGEAWIREKLSDAVSPLYADWIQDLITLCRSHHEGLHDLHGGRFDAKIVGSPAQVVNLRYLAAVLRVADILEFDPERTPDVIFRHRNIAPKSKIFWAKDHAISLSVDPGTYDIIISARTPDAQIHRAVLDTIDNVNQELFLCDTLKHEDAFLRGVKPAKYPPYVWPWPARVTTDVRERDDSFVYIEGTFRPDAKKVVQLLSGTALYSDAMAAIRELIQNSFDAVNEQIAHQRLARSSLESNDPRFLANLRGTHQVSVVLRPDGGRYVLVCSDTGVGMSKDIIEKYLLVSGASQRPDLAALARHCHDRGFLLDRVGEFGIGVLSYFMLADHLSFSTRRSDEAGDDPSKKAWRFVIDGLNGFGQLTPYTMVRHGSEVTLRLRQDVIGPNPDAWFSRLRAYIEHTLVSVPCKFQLRHESATTAPLDIPSPGWASLDQRAASRTLSNVRSDAYFSHGDLRPAAEIERERQDAEAWSQCRAEAVEKLRFYGPIEDTLPNAAGKYRIYLPYFQLEGGSCLAYLRADKAGTGEDLPSGIHAVPCAPCVEVGWRGMRVEGVSDAARGHSSLRAHHFMGRDPGFMAQGSFHLTVDVQNSAKISVDRSSLTIEPDLFHGIRARVSVDCRNLLNDFLKQNRSSAYETLNRAVALEWFPTTSVGLCGLPCSVKLPIGDRSNTYEWRPLSYPCIELLAGSLSLPKLFSGIEVGGKPIDYYRVVSTPGHDSFISPLFSLPGKRLVIFEEGPFHFPAPAWDGPPEFLSDQIGFETSFPDLWKGVCAVVLRKSVLWNSGHPAVRSLTREAWHWAMQNLNDCDPRNHVLDISQHQDKAAAWLLRCISARMRVRFWDAVYEKVPEAIGALEPFFCGLTASSIHRSINVWDFGGRFSSSSDVLEIASEGAKFSENVDRHRDGLTFSFANELLPWPSETRWQGKVVLKVAEPGRHMLQYLS